jgi:hypothetical protein
LAEKLQHFHLFVTGVETLLYGSITQCVLDGVFMSEKPFDAEACPPMLHATASNGLLDMVMNVENAPSNRPLKVRLHSRFWSRFRARDGADLQSDALLCQIDAKLHRTINLAQSRAQSRAQKLEQKT